MGTHFKIALPKLASAQHNTPAAVNCISEFEVHLFDKYGRPINEGEAVMVISCSVPCVPVRTLAPFQCLARLLISEVLFAFRRASELTKI
jgi:hypothetical protein